MVSTRRLLQSIFILLPVSGVVQGKEEKPKREIEKLIALRTHSLFAPYIDQDLQNRWWDFGADSYVNTNKHIRLTRPAPSQMGWLWSRLPITAPNFHVEVEFKINGEQSHLYGDGMAIWLTTERAQPGPVFGSKDEFTGLGLFIDTYANNPKHDYSFPRVVAMLGDGKTPYDQGGDGEENAIASCSAAIRRTTVATKFRIIYIRNESLTVNLHYRGWDEWTECFTIQNVTLPQNPFLGFSAITGDVTDAHDIISVMTSSVVMSASTGSTSRAPLRAPPKKGSSWFTFKNLFKLVFFAAVCAIAVVVARAYAVQRGGLRVAGVDVLNRQGGFGNFEWQNSKRF